ncbi:SusD-like starch-binding protein associating with outer membrane [Chitinophaga polysaccharea]|uniref:SusD-like starch-binding protein associating with outer membrane n=1 Tax=Chitinophaga polysaccharea TaxID=1293035 RepID=A0A561PT56_9BACT|nr:SusD/RagB family nutrient-binding outer membrane lipoprotein [Chitinophaga polysaccharea]TWF41304.1 SusD-like starch-binding protein associating with outer membrane [Chitinophaga polysaccharea]
MKRQYITYILLLVLSLYGCKPGDFGDINTNPNMPTKPYTGYLLTNIIRDMASTIGGSSGGPIREAPLYAQHLSEMTYQREGVYVKGNWDFGYYQGALNDLQVVISVNSDPARKAQALSFGSNANQLAVARILRAYFFLHLTDRWGDVPYFEALKGNDNLTPAYDRQQDIYNDLFKELKAAAAQFDGGVNVKGDILFGGDPSRWKKFANTMRLVMALRLSKIDAVKGKTEFNAALADGVITDNKDNVVYNYLAGDQNNENYWSYSWRVDNNPYALSKTLVDMLLANNDPRLPKFGDKAGDGLYHGQPYGVINTNFGSMSMLGAGMRKPESPVYVYTAAEVQFALAEAVKLGWIPGNDIDAATYYLNGIKYSLQQFGVYTDAAYATCIATPGVAYDPAHALEQIGTQKWVALFLNGWEAWYEWRRTGFPRLQPPANAQTRDGQIPRRHGYPSREALLNKAHYDAAVQRLGGPDDLSSRVWWDKQ